MGRLLRALIRIFKSLAGADREGPEEPPAPPPLAVGEGQGQEAGSLNDLLRIRADNRDGIEAVNGNLGTALGFKWSDGQRTEHPCVIIFVPQKTDPWLVPESEMAPERLEAHDGTWCLTDVVTGGKAESPEDFDTPPPLSVENRQIVRELRSGRMGLIGGIQLAVYVGGIEDGAHAFAGTAGIAVVHAGTGKVGLLTNHYVADAPGRVVYHPRHDRFRIGVTYEAIEYATDETWYDGLIDEAGSHVRCDCAFVEVDGHLSERLSPGLHAIGTTGPLLRIDPGTMDIVGQKVVSVGRTRGVQRGTVVAFAYEFHDAEESAYTDLLIVGEEGEVFSDKGDSGKVIATDDEEHRPVALLWGGWQERLRLGREQEKWTYAIDLGKVLDRLKLRLLE